MNTDAADRSSCITETATTGGLEDGELDSEKEESTAVATASCTARGVFTESLVKIDKCDDTAGAFSKESVSSRVSHKFQEAPMKGPSTDDITENDIDEYEMLCIRGGSPPTVLERDKIYTPLDENIFNDSSYFYESDESYDINRAPRRNRKRRKDRSRKRRKSCRNHRSNDKMDARENNSRGEKNTKINSPGPSDDTHSTEDKVENRKLEICKFYLMDCCIKSHICHYMHADFPCKYYYLGLECENEKPCKFLHGKALSDDMKTALIRHIIAAPRAILGNFKRMSKERVESMLEARNTQLLMEESGIYLAADKQIGSTSKMGQTSCEETSSKFFQNGNVRSDVTKHFPNTKNVFQNFQSFQQEKTNKLELGPIQSLKNFPEVFADTQLKALSDMGITFLHQINHLSLAKLSEIGLSVVQINELQQKSNNPKLEKSSTSQSTENSLKSNDSHLKSVPTVEEKMRELNFDETEVDRRNVGHFDDIDCTQSVLEDILNPSNAVFDELSTLDLLDDESKLVIDESVRSESEIEEEHSPWRTEDYQGAQGDKNSSDFVNNNEIGASRNETGLTFSERIDRDIQSSTLVSLRGDFDMRMPFVPVTDFIPATEIHASINSHPPIKYKLIEIYIPKRQQSIEFNIDLSENNLLDPRRKRYLQLQNNNVTEDNTSTSSSATAKPYDKSPNLGYSSNVPFGGLSSDPRKRKEAENCSAQPNIPNFQSILNGYLQKSRWYQDQKSHCKIHINQLLARLSSELSRFHQNPSAGVCFELWDMELADKIDEVLFNLGIQIDSFGNICEGATETNAPREGISGIPSLLTLNVSEAPVNYHGYSPSPNIPPFLPPSLLPPSVTRLDMPKPGLLGIAPGLEYPPPFPMQPPSPALIRFQREMVQRHHRWQNCPPATPFYHPQRPVGPLLGHSFDGRRGICENGNENRRRGQPFERRGNSKRLKRF